MKTFLLSRNYRPKIVDAAIAKAKLIPREEAIKKKTKQKEERNVFVVTYHPALPSLTKILAKHWRTMTKDPHLKNVFPRPPMVAYRRQPNLKDKLVQAKVPEIPTRPVRKLKGMRKCNIPCPICPFVEEGKVVKSTKSDDRVEINAHITCQTRNLIYCAICEKCSQQYTRQTEPCKNESKNTWGILEMKS